MKSARQLYAEINAQYPTMPFSLRGCDDKSARLGLKEVLGHDLLLSFPPTVERGQIIAQYRYTALVQEGQTTRLTSHPVPHVHSAYR